MDTNGKRRVLVTGAEGTIGTLLTERLADRFDFRPLTRDMADVADLDALAPHLEGIDAIVHLAASADVASDWDEVLHNNIVGARSVYEAAHRAGVGLVVFASTNHVVGMYEVDGSPWADDPRHPEQVGTDVPVRPDSLYGASKAWGEAVGRYYSEMLGLRVVSLRIGWVTEDDRVPGAAEDAGPAERERMRRRRGLWLSHADCASLIGAALDAPDDLRWAVVYGVSNNPGRWFDLEPGRRLLGWEPEESETERE